MDDEFEFVGWFENGVCVVPGKYFVDIVKRKTGTNESQIVISTVNAD